MFYYEQLFNMALQGIDNTPMVPTIVNIAYSILLVCFLFGMYQALARGGDVRHLGVTFLKYLATGIVLLAYSLAFKSVNGMFNQLAHFIDSSSGAANMLNSWGDQLKAHLSGASGTELLWSVITATGASISAFIYGLLIVLGFILFPITYTLFACFYMLYGSILYVVGPLVIALYPAMGIGQLARTFIVNLMIFNGWGVLFALFGALMTAVNANNIANILSSDSFLGSWTGAQSNLLLGLVSVFYSLAIALIPFIASRIVKGEVGTTLLVMLATAFTAGKSVLAGSSGAAGGYRKSVDPGPGGGSSRSSPTQPGHYSGVNVAHAAGYDLGRAVGTIARHFKK